MLTAGISACIKETLVKLIYFCLLILTWKKISNIFGAVLISKMQIEHTYCVFYVEDHVNDRTCRKWFAKFCVEDLSLNETSLFGRTVEIASD